MPSICTLPSVNSMRYRASRRDDFPLPVYRGKTEKRASVLAVLKLSPNNAPQDPASAPKYFIPHFFTNHHTKVCFSGCWKKISYCTFLRQESHLQWCNSWWCSTQMQCILGPKNPKKLWKLSPKNIPPPKYPPGDRLWKPNDIPWGEEYYLVGATLVPGDPIA